MWKIEKNRNVNTLIFDICLISIQLFSNFFLVKPFFGIIGLQQFMPCTKSIIKYEENPVKAVQN